MKPKYIRIYDNGGKTIDRYTVVYTRKSERVLDGLPGHTPWYKGTRWYSYVCMNESPFHPQGFCQHGEHTRIIDRPSYGHLGKKVLWEDLPEDCKQVVIRDYEEIWGKGKMLIEEV